MAWTTATTRSSGYLVTAAVWNSEHVNNMNHLKEVGYTEFTGITTVTATTDATAQTIVSAGAITLEAVPHLIEVFCPRIVCANVANALAVFTLWDSGTDLGKIAQQGQSATGGTGGAQLYAIRRITPTAASHTYILKSYRSGGDASVQAGVGGTATLMPGFIRITRVPV